LRKSLWRPWDQLRCGSQGWRGVWGDALKLGEEEEPTPRREGMHLDRHTPHRTHAHMQASEPDRRRGGGGGGHRHAATELTTTNVHDDEDHATTDGVLLFAGWRRRRRWR
jgi:hypothetical protein